MSLDSEALEKVLGDWIEGAVNSETILAHPNAPRPKGQYAVYHVIQATQQGNPDSSYSADNPPQPEDRIVTAQHSNLYNLMVSVNVYRENAFFKASALRDSTLLITVRDALWAGGLAFIESSEVRDIPEEVDKKWEPRAQVDFFFYAVSLETETVDEIKTVELTNEIDGSTTTIP